MENSAASSLGLKEIFSRNSSVYYFMVLYVKVSTDNGSTAATTKRKTVRSLSLVGFHNTAFGGQMLHFLYKFGVNGSSGTR